MSHDTPHSNSHNARTRLIYYTYSTVICPIYSNVNHRRTLTLYPVGYVELKSMAAHIQLKGDKKHLECGYLAAGIYFLSTNKGSYILL